MSKKNLEPVFYELIGLVISTSAVRGRICKNFDCIYENGRGGWDLVYEPHLRRRFCGWGAAFAKNGIVALGHFCDWKAASAVMHPQYKNRRCGYDKSSNPLAHFQNFHFTRALSD